MTAAIPRTRPKMTRDEVVALVRSRHPDEDLPDTFVVGIRGYYRDSMGKVGQNDRGLYDDALFLITPTKFLSFNANTDPSRSRPGAGFGAGKGMAVLRPGFWHAHALGKHKSLYLALVQSRGKVIVDRDGHAGSYPETGMFGINIHKGGINSTSSEGCQTIPPSQWDEFIHAVAVPAKAQGVVPYVLLDGVT